MYLAHCGLCSSHFTRRVLRAVSFSQMHVAPIVLKGIYALVDVLASLASSLHLGAAATCSLVHDL